MRTIQRQIVSALIFSLDNKLLMGMKSSTDGGVYVDCWHIPGGGVESDETLEAALQRELLEEVGINVVSREVSLVDKQGEGEAEKRLKDTGEIVLCKMQFVVYRVNMPHPAKDIQLTIGSDLAKLEWVDMDKLATYHLTPPSTTLFERLGYL